MVVYAQISLFISNATVLKLTWSLRGTVLSLMSDFSAFYIYRSGFSYWNFCNSYTAEYDIAGAGVVTSPVVIGTKTSTTASSITLGVSLKHSE